MACPPRRTAPPTEKEFFTIGEVAQRLRLRPRTVHRKLASRELASHKFGRAVRISASDLAAFVAACRRR
jgi:excisionase family DNA binding protein